MKGERQGKGCSIRGFVGFAFTAASAVLALVKEGEYMYNVQR